MDDTLYCNWLKCRKPLHIHGQAVVTTWERCRYIFCVSCANELFGANKACPACEANLDRPDDVVISSLNPSTDYRTSVLAGLAPSITMEIATRSISFWTYQKSQEATFQAMVLKNAQERNAVLEKRMQSMSMESANEMSLLHEKIADLVTEKRKTKDLQDALRNATKDYDRLKRSALNQSLANQPRATIGGTQKPASFWQAQSSGQTTDHAVQSTPSRLANNGAGPGPQMNYTPNHGANHGRFMAGGSASGAGGAGFGDHGDRAAPQLFGHESGSDMRQHGMNAAGVRGMNAQAAGAGLSGHNNSHNVNLSRQGGGSGNAASPMVASNWAQPRPISQNLVRPVPTNGVRLSSSSEGLVMHQGMSMSRAHMSGSGSTDPLQTPRGPSPVGNFLRSAGLRSGRGGHQGGGTPYRSIR
ncbi:unnamed protein product [Tilletia controversa]|nr:unnamed protein product [Tilletia controversa]CAD6973951.1 unnamed protein product [Tilletia controversa]CAD6979045.1 unnamed protein product [Tilletia controversa]